MSKNHRGAGQQLRTKVADVKQDLQELGALAQDAALEKVAEVQDSVRERTADLRDTASRTAEDLRARAGQFIDDGREQVMGLERSLEQRIRDKPWHSVAIAAGVGVLLGILWVRR